MNFQKRSPIYGEKGINIYINGNPIHYFALDLNSYNKFSFLISKEYFQFVSKYINQGNNIFFKRDNNNWFEILIDTCTIHNNIWGYSSYFECKVIGVCKQADNSIIRDMKINSIINK